MNEIFTGRESDGDRLDVENLIILITDGGSDDKEATYNAARNVKQQSIHIIAIGKFQYIAYTMNLNLNFEIMCHGLIDSLTLA